MYIEIEFNNEEENIQPSNDENLPYSKLESSRKEERRQFSPPFKVDRKLDI